MVITNQYDSVKAQVAVVMADLKSVNGGFKMPPNAPEGVKIMASFMRSGDVESATKAGIEVLKTGRYVMRAFFHNSVFDQPEKPNKPAKTARFTVEIQRRANHPDGSYDGDIIARLEKMREALATAVTSETGDVFTQRIAAYNAMSAELVLADARQKELDEKRKAQERKRFQVERLKIQTEEMLEKRPGYKKPKPVHERTAVLLRREEEADALLALI